MSSFFTLPKSQRKRKRTDAGNAKTAKKHKNRNTGASTTTRTAARAQRDESISSSESDEDDEPRRPDALDDEVDDLGSDEDEENERGGGTAAERRLRLAERYLDNIRQEVDETGFDAEQIDRDLIAERLKEDVVCFFYILYQLSKDRHDVVFIGPLLMFNLGRVKRPVVSPRCPEIVAGRCITHAVSSGYTYYHVHRRVFAVCVYRLERYDAH